MWFCKLNAHQVIVCTRNLNHDIRAFERRSWIWIIHIKMVKFTQAPVAFYYRIDLIPSDRPFLNHSMADNVIGFRCSSVMVSSQSTKFEFNVFSMIHLNDHNF